MNKSKIKLTINQSIKCNHNLTLVNMDNPKIKYGTICPITDEAASYLNDKISNNKFFLNDELFIDKSSSLNFDGNTIFNGILIEKNSHVTISKNAFLKDVTIKHSNDLNFGLMTCYIEHSKLDSVSVTTEVQDKIDDLIIRYSILKNVINLDDNTSIEHSEIIDKFGRIRINRSIIKDSRIDLTRLTRYITKKHKNVSNDNLPVSNITNSTLYNVDLLALNNNDQATPNFDETKVGFHIVDSHFSNFTTTQPICVNHVTMLFTSDKCKNLRQIVIITTPMYLKDRDLYVDMDRPFYTLDDVIEKQNKYPDAFTNYVGSKALHGNLYITCIGSE